MAICRKNFWHGCIIAIVACGVLELRWAAAQSDTRPTGSATRPLGSDTRPTVAEPKAAYTNPFLPAIDREVRLPLALRGFCAVTLRDQQTWSDGMERFQHIFDGQVYWFAARRERAIFAANPIRYVPALQGDCPVTFVESGARIQGNPQYGILHKQRLYFFKGPAAQRAFRADPDGYTNADLKFGGNCVVSRVDQQRELEGLPETVVIVDGFRYQFASQRQQQLFVRNMVRYGVKQTLVTVAGNGQGSREMSPPQALAPGQTDEVKPTPKSEMERKSKRVSLADAVMGGYCPVSIRSRGVWVKGEPRYAAVFDARTYFMAGESELALFREDPLPFIPALGGSCVVTERDENRRVPGNIYHAAFHESQDRLFLFAGVEQKQAFNGDAERYLNVDVAANGMCVVSLVDERTEVEGLPEYTSWHNGKRYFFASAEHQARFAADVSTYEGY
ncbi:MAG: hypothetical protein AAGD11_12340 [Planctomycetota bacterium]